MVVSDFCAIVFSYCALSFTRLIDFDGRKAEHIYPYSIRTLHHSDEFLLLLIKQNFLNISPHWLYPFLNLLLANKTLPRFKCIHDGFSFLLYADTRVVGIYPFKDCFSWFSSIHSRFFSYLCIFEHVYGYFSLFPFSSGVMMPILMGYYNWRQKLP